jgi:hypothetical protein
MMLLRVLILKGIHQNLFLIECSDDDFNIDQVLQTKIHLLLIKNKYNLISWTLNTGIYKINNSNSF